MHLRSHPAEYVSIRPVPPPGPIVDPSRGCWPPDASHRFPSDAARFRSFRPRDSTAWMTRRSSDFEGGCGDADVAPVSRLVEWSGPGVDPLRGGESGVPGPGPD